MTADRINWGILTTGKIARKFAAALPHSATGHLYAVAGRDGAAAEQFAREFGADRHYEGYQRLLDDPAVRAVYIATPHPMHGEWAIRAMEAGKAVLCEKPLEVNLARAREVIRAAESRGAFLMEAFMYRCHPQTHRLIEVLKSGAIGQIRLIRATFGYRGEFGPAKIKLNHATAGGGILDVGCYTVSMSRLVAGVALGTGLAEPETVTGEAFIDPERGIDEYAVGTLRFPGGILAQVATAVRLDLDNRVIVYGDSGRLTVETPWVGSGIEGGVGRLVLETPAGTRVEEIKTDQWLYGIEADTVAAHLDSTEAAWPAPGWADTLGNMEVLDRWRQAVGLSYEWDTRSVL